MSVSAGNVWDEIYNKFNLDHLEYIDMKYCPVIYRSIITHSKVFEQKRPRLQCSLVVKGAVMDRYIRMKTQHKFTLENIINTLF